MFQLRVLPSNAAPDDNNAPIFRFYGLHGLLSTQGMLKHLRIPGSAEWMPEKKTLPFSCPQRTELPFILLHLGNYSKNTKILKPSIYKVSAGVPAKNRTWISGLGNPCSIR